MEDVDNLKTNQSHVINRLISINFNIDVYFKDN